MREIINETLAEFQDRNCKGCFYANEKEVGTGRACCTWPQPLNLEGGKCLTRKEEEGPKVQ